MNLISKDTVASAFEMREMVCVPVVAFAIFDGGEVAVASGYFERLWIALN
ncbi:MAG: hypothetical protein NWE96_02145 [Candidatus Bathyarchaeota archaeon]|nr:hypothetical protein [Candidatus Bathyarchaeota archaeon]